MNANYLFNFVDNNGSPISNINVVASLGDVAQSDSNGQAIVNIDAAAGATLRPATFYFYTNGNCLGEFSTQSLNFPDIRIGRGYDNTESDPIELATVTATLTEIPNTSYLKLGGVYEYGIVYYDRANRSGNTNFKDGSTLFVPFYTEGFETLDNVSTPPIVNWEIKSLPPTWATHYQWVRTRNNALSSYIQWATDEVEYQTESGDPSNRTDATRISLDISNLTDEYKTANPDSVLSYDYSSRDRIRLIKDSNSNYFDNYIDLKVLGFAEGKILIENLGTLPDISEGVMFEVYTPRLIQEDNIFYEIGECFDVVEAVDAQGDTIKIHKGLTQDQDVNDPSGVPALGTFRTGDTYYRNRVIPFTTGNVSFGIDSSLFSDFWQSRISDIGRPNIIDKDARRVTRPTTIYYSERFIPETNINGLNNFYDTSFESYDRDYGKITKLFSHNKRLDCYQELKVSKILVEENVIFDQFDNGTIASSDKVLSKAVYYQGEFGTMNPESFTENEGRRYFFDIRNGKVLRLSNDGLTPISDKKMHSYFESKSNFYSAFGIIPEIWGTFDENYNEYIISFGAVSRAEGFTPDDLALVSSQAETVTEIRNGLTYTFIIGYDDNAQGVDTDFTIVRDLQNGTYVINSIAGDLTLDRQRILSIPAETLGFSELTGHWTSFYTYVPECMGRIGIDFLSFRNGQAFLHNQSGDRNTFYGATNSSEVWAVFNQDPSITKVFQALIEESDTVWEAREILTQNNQKSNLILDDFAVDYGQGHTLYSKENMHYAALWADENTPNVDLPLINGDSMRDVSVLIKLINSSTEEERLYAASLRYSLSPRVNA